jgi:phosphonate transport system substrate-binding protein
MNRMKMECGCGLRVNGAGRRRGWRVPGLPLLVLLVLLVGGCGGREPAAELVLALKPDKDADAMLEERELLSAWLGKELGMPVRVIVPASGAVIEQGLANRTVDLAWVSATSLAGYVETGAAELLLAGEVDGRTWYESYWVSLAEGPYRSVEDLAGLPVCFASPTSTSGYVVPVHDLRKRGLIDASGGLEAFFGRGNVLYGTGYVSAIQRVFNGQAEAAAVSDYVIKGDKHLTAADKARLQLVQAQGPVPTHCLAVRAGMDPVDVASLKAAFLKMNTDHPAMRDRVFTSVLKEVDEQAHLAPIREALAFARSLTGR